MAHFVHKLNLAVLSVPMLACFQVNAQDVSQAELAECAAMTTAAEKLACYEALTVSPEPAPAQPAAEPRESARAEPVEAAPPRTPRETAVDAEAAVPMAVSPAPAAEPPAAPIAAVPEAESVAPAAVVSESRSSVPDDLGMEQLERDDREVEPDPFPMTATVSEVTESSSGRLYFEFSNGQVWRQIEPRRFHYPKNQEFEVTVSQGLMGDYRLRVGGNGPMTRIRRVE